MEKNEEIKKALSYRKLSISRVPLNTFRKFEDLSNSDEFCNDYGMLLRELIKEHYELIELKKVLYRLTEYLKNDKKEL